MPDIPSSPLIAPFTGERYASPVQLSQQIAPPYDVIAPPVRAALAGRSPHNIVHVILPEGNGDRYRNAANHLADWRRQGVLVRDSEPALYVVQQQFETSGNQRHVRTGVIGALSVEPYSAGRIKPHERTHA